MKECLFNSNTFYYFFSTISQTFGAILGVIGMLIIFLIQNTKNNIESLIMKIEMKQHPTRTMLRKDISDITVVLPQVETSNDSEIKKYGEKLKELAMLQNDIIKQTKLFFWLLSIIILGSLVMLPFSNYLAKYFWIALLLIIIFLIGAGFIFRWTLRFLLKILMSFKISI